MADREFVFDGSEKWSVDFARRLIAHTGLPLPAAEIERSLEAISASLAPVPKQWLADRLTLLWTMFMASRPVTDPDALTVWLAEYMRLLGDLPHDIAATSIDRAVQTSRHNFLPSIGEIRSIAEADLRTRNRHADRLGLLHASYAGNRQIDPVVNRDAVDDDAQCLSDWLRDRWGEDLISVSAIQQYGPGRIRQDAAYIRRLVDVLVSHGHLSQRLADGGMVKGNKVRECWSVKVRNG